MNRGTRKIGSLSGSTEALALCLSSSQGMGQMLVGTKQAPDLRDGLNRVRMSFPRAGFFIKDTASNPVLDTQFSL